MTLRWTQIQNVVWLLEDPLEGVGWRKKDQFRLSVCPREKHPKFLADAKPSRLEVKPLGGAVMQAMIYRILGYDVLIVARSNEMVAPPR